MPELTHEVFNQPQPLVDTNRIKCLAVTGKARSPALPKVPTLEEAGIKHADVDLRFWFAQVDETNTTIWAQFQGVNPNEADVEINVRQTVFYPAQPGINYLTVRGFTMMHAATPWAPPTAEQVGLEFALEIRFPRQSEVAGPAIVVAPLQTVHDRAALNGHAGL